MQFSFHIPYSGKSAFKLAGSVSRSSKLEKQTSTKRDLPKHKIFCIGFGKTGTTSLGAALQEMGFQMGNQPVAEVLSEDWANRRTDRILRFCHTAQAFQDLPFGLPGLYRELDQAFPDAKFILTVRNSSEEWYQSLLRFHTKIFSSDKTRPPTEEDLATSSYRYQGWALDMKKLFFGYPEKKLYDKDHYTHCYETHNREVTAYFSDRKQDFLKLNVAEPGAYQELCHFLSIPADADATFPWLNKSAS